MEPEEWADIFQYTGHVWRRKEFPTKLGGNRRAESKRLMRVLELMKEEHARNAAAAVAAAAKGEPASVTQAADAKAMESELWVHSCVLEEVRLGVGVRVRGRG